MLRVDEVITRKEVAVVFDDRDITASLPKDAECVVLAESSSGGLLEYLHLDTLDILALPLVENSAEKIAQSVRRYSAVANVASLSVRLRLNQGQKANVWGFDLLEEPVDFGRVVDILRVYHAQYVAQYPVLTQEFISAYCLTMGGFPAFGKAMAVMHFLRTVQANPHGEALCSKKAAPVLINEGAVGLNTVDDLTVRGLMLAL